MEKEQNSNNELDPTTYRLTFGKYKGETLKDVFEKNPNYIYWLNSDEFRAKSEELKTMLLIIKKEIVLKGSLTKRVKQIIGCGLFKEVINNINISTKFETTELGYSYSDTIRELHMIEPSLSGVFIDYLIRRLLCEYMEKTFKDDRTDYVLTTHTEKTKIRIRKNKEDELDSLDIIENCDDLESIVYREPSHDLPIKLLESYKKVRKTSKYKSVDIIPEIFVVSLSHTIFFREYTETIKDKAFELFKTIKTNFLSSHIIELRDLILNYVGEKVSLNPNLSLNDIDADADIISDNTLIEIKTTKYFRHEYNLLQALGYTALAKFRSMQMDKILIINPLLNRVDCLNTKDWTNDNCYSYLIYLNNGKDFWD